jgi:Domain of unknown function (DUF4396)
MLNTIDDKIGNGMEFLFLSFLMSPYFVLAWYGFGLFSAGWTLNDEMFTNSNVNLALKPGWIVIIIFFSAIGLWVYIKSCRPPGIEKLSGESAKKKYHEFVSVTWKKVIGSVIHCVGGDGLGIMTAMVISRVIGLDFWTEFWIEYAVGFAFGWFIFQYIAMKRMGNSTLMSLWKGGRAEFFSMITVMLGMGFVMKFVTPNGQLLLN